MRRHQTGITFTVISMTNQNINNVFEFSNFSQLQFIKTLFQWNSRNWIKIFQFMVMGVGCHSANCLTYNSTVISFVSMMLLIVLYYMCREETPLWIRKQIQNQSCLKELGPRTAKLALSICLKLKMVEYVWERLI